MPVILYPPIPSNTIDFQSIFTGEYDTLIILTKRRAKLLQVLMNDDASSLPKKVTAACEYYEELDKYTRHISVMKTRHFVKWSWSFKLFDTLDFRDDSDTSILFERLASGLAYTSCLFNTQQYMKCRTLLIQLHQVQQTFTPRHPKSIIDRSSTTNHLEAIFNRTDHFEIGKESYLFAPTLYSGLIHLVNAHIIFVFACKCLEDQDNKVACDYMFSTLDELKKACNSFPYIDELTTMYNNNVAKSYMLLADVLLDNDAVGLGITCLEEAQACNVQDTVIASQITSRLHKFRQANRLEYNFQKVPARDKLEIDFSQRDDFISIIESDDESGQFTVSVVSGIPTFVTFRHPLSRDFINRLEDLLDYPCTEYVLDSTLLLYLTPSLRNVLISHFHRDIQVIYAANTSALCSSQFGQHPRHETFSSDKVYMNGSRVELLGSGPVRLRNVQQVSFLIHPGALSHTANYETIKTTLTSDYLSYCSRTGLTCNSEDVVGLDGSNSIININSIHLDHALSFVDGVLAKDVNPFCWAEPVYDPFILNSWSSSTAQKLVHGASHSSSAQALTCLGSTDCSPIWSAGIRGSGQLIGISDTGIATDSCFFKDTKPVPFTSSKSVPGDTGHVKIRAYWSYGDTSDAHGHGTHVCGTAAGKAGSGGGSAGGDAILNAADFNGVAPLARLVFIDVQRGSGGLSIPSPYDTQLLQWIYSTGARIHSGSWGIADFRYSQEDYQVDIFCWHHRDFIAIFAAGNSGTSGPNSILSPALAKNAIAVGAAMPGYAPHTLPSSSNPQYPVDAYNYDWIADFSSRGGSGMGVSWLKPNIVGAGGHYIWSADNDNTGQCSNINNVVVGMAGTSMATPQIAGSAALVREYFLQRHYKSTRIEPMASLVKAILAASALPSRGVYPQRLFSSISFSSSTYQPYQEKYYDGHGRISLDRALDLPTTSASLQVLANEDEVFTFTSQVHFMHLTGTGSGTVDVSIVLAWTDFPASLTSQQGLVNDLDLRVTHNSVIHNGNDIIDRGSPLEVVRITTSLPVTLDISILAHKIGYSQQEYSLIAVAVGPSVSWTISNGSPVPPPQSTSSTSSTTSATSPPPPKTTSPPPTSKPVVSPTPKTTSPTPNPIFTPIPPFPTQSPTLEPPAPKPTPPLPTSAPPSHAMTISINILVVMTAFIIITF